MAGLEVQTVDNDRLHLTVAINYGGRDEILRATRRVAESVREGRLNADDITPARSRSISTLPACRTPT